MIPRLVAVTPGDGRDLRPWLAALAAAGLPGVVLREPAGDADALVAAAAGIAWVAVHERTPGARALAAARGLPLHVTATGAPGTAPWGRSCHDAAAVDAAFAAGAAWVFLSPVASPASKPDDRRAPLGLPAFLAIGGARPVFALGGVTPAHLAAIVGAGGHGAAVLGGLFGVPSPDDAAARARAYVAALQNTQISSS